MSHLQMGRNHIGVWFGPGNVPKKILWTGPKFISIPQVVLELKKQNSWGGGEVYTPFLLFAKSALKGLMKNLLFFMKLESFMDFLMCSFSIKLDAAFTFKDIPWYDDSSNFTSSTDCSRQGKVMPDIIIHIIHTHKHTHTHTHTHTQ